MGHDWLSLIESRRALAINFEIKLARKRVFGLASTVGHVSDRIRCWRARRVVRLSAGVNDPSEKKSTSDPAVPPRQIDGSPYHNLRRRRDDARR